MSAGGISYSGVSGNRKVTLPSVESWGSNMNILRDPPKSIHTRKKDRVSDTQIVERMADEGTQSRYAEGIQIYPRGVNPSVSVSYNNYGNNGAKLMYMGNGDSAQYGGSSEHGDGRPSYWESSSISGHTMAKYPRRIDLDGDFRPPLMPQSKLIAMSRLPRNITNLYTNPIAPQWKERNTCDECVYKRATHDNIFNTNMRATSCHYIGPTLAADTRSLASANISKAISEDMVNTNYEVNKGHDIGTGIEQNVPKNSIKDQENTAIVASKVMIQDNTERYRSDTSKYIDAPTNMNVHSKFTQLANIDLAAMSDNNFKMRDNINIDAQTNKSNHRTAYVDVGAAPMKIREQYNQTVNTNHISDYTRNNLNTEVKHLEKNVPMTNINTSVSGNELKQAHHMYDQTYTLEQKQNHTTAYTNPQNMRQENLHNIVRGAKLQPTLSVQESFEGRGTRPIEYHDNTPHVLDNASNGVNKTAYNMYANRFGSAYGPDE